MVTTSSILLHGFGHSALKLAIDSYIGIMLLFARVSLAVLV